MRQKSLVASFFDAKLASLGAPASNNRPPMFGFTEHWRPFCTTLFVLYERNLTYVTTLFFTPYKSIIL